MSKNISSGINKNLGVIGDPAQTDYLKRQWRELRKKIDGVLISGNINSADENLRKCAMIDRLNPIDREKHITDNWGINYYNRVSQLLSQLAKIESVMNK